MLAVFVGATTESARRVGLGVNFLLKDVQERPVVGSELAKEDSVMTAKVSFSFVFDGVVTIARHEERM